MDFNQAFSEISNLRDHLYHDPEQYVREWSSQLCSDYQVPLIRLISLLSDGASSLRVRDNPESMAILDIVKHSGLQHLLEFDLPNNVVQFKSDISSTEKKVISDYLNSRASIIAD